MTKINKEGWENVPLCTVSNVLNGYAFKSDKYVNEGVRVLRITNVQKGSIVDNDPKFYSFEDFEELGNYELFEGDLLMSLTGNVGRVGILEAAMIPAALNQRVACLRITSDVLLKKYLFHLLNSDLFEQEAIASARGIAQKNMSTEWLKAYKIPLPPLPIQQRIVEELDEINAIISAKKLQLSKLDELAQSIFYNMFGDPVANDKGWEVNKLGEITHFYNGKAHENAIKENGNYTLINSKFIASNGEIKKQTDALMFPLFVNDITMVMSDVPNGRALAKCFLIKEDNKYTLNQRICVFRNYNLESLFLFRLLNRHEYFLSFNDGNGQTNLRKNDILNCPIILPPLHLQEAFAARVAAIEEEKATIAASIKKMQTLLDARMQEYFG